jgi:nucleoside-triphosphatase
MTETPGRNLLLTGAPSCGKTTVLARLIEDRLADLRLAGFYTAELREGGRRIGFEAVGWHGRRAVLARLGGSSLRVGRYAVDPVALTPLIEDELERPVATVDLFFIDEIGKMEVASPRFCQAVLRVLDGPVPVVATVALRGGGLMGAVKARADVTVLEVTQDNRDALPENLEAWVRGSISG